MDLHSTQIVNSPAGVADWPITTSISRVEVGPQGVRVFFDKETEWPNLDFETNGPSPDGGGCQYTVWVAVYVSPQWYAAGFLQMWKGRDWTGAAFLRNDDFYTNWADERFGPMHVKLNAGDTIALFITKGNARFKQDAPAERSQVVEFQVPANDQGGFTFDPVPVELPRTPTPNPSTSTPGLDLGAVLAEINAKLDALKVQMDADTEKVQTQIAQVVANAEASAKAASPLLKLFSFGGK